MATCNSQTLLDSASTSGFTTLSYEDKINVILQLLCDIDDGGGGGGGGVEIGVAASDQTSNLATGTGKVVFRWPKAFTLSSVRANVSTAPTGSSLIVDVLQGGVSIFSTLLSIDATEKTSTTAATPAVISTSAMTDDAEVSVSITQVGSTVPGIGLKLWFIGA